MASQSSAALVWYSAAAKKGFQPAADRLALLEQSGKVELSGHVAVLPGCEIAMVY